MDLNLTADRPGSETGHRPDFEIGKVLVRPDHSLLSSSRGERRIEPKVMDVLCLLASHPDDVVTRNTLIDEIWQVEYGADESLTRAISLLRKTFVELDPHTLYIRTVPRRGYSLVARVRDAGPEPGMDTAKTVAPPPDRQLSILQYVIALVFMAILGGLMTLMVLRSGSRSATPASPSIAVLPFQSLGNDPQLDYFAQGVAEEVLNILSGLDELKVAGDNSAFSFGDGFITRAEIGERLGVDHLLEGSVRSNGDEIRISTQLVQTRDNRQIWSNSFVTGISTANQFSVQRDIALQVAGALSIALDVDTRNQLQGTDTDSLEAYEHFLRGRNFDSWRRGDRYAALQSYQRAIEIDPDYVSALNALALKTGGLSWEAPTPEAARELIEKGAALAEKAAELDPTLAETQSIVATFRVGTNDWTGAAEAHERALELARNSQTVGQYAAFLVRAGRLREALSETRAAYDLDPLNSGRAASLALVFTALGQFEESRAVLARARNETGDLPITNIAAWLLAMHEDLPSSEARDLTAGLAAEAPETAFLLTPVVAAFEAPEIALGHLHSFAAGEDLAFPEQLEVMATLAAYFGDDALALDLWTRELSGTNLRMLRLWGPRFSGMRERAGFKELVTSLGLPEYWRIYGWADACRPAGKDFVCH